VVLFIGSVKCSDGIYQAVILEHALKDLQQDYSDQLHNLRLFNIQQWLSQQEVESLVVPK